MRYPSQESRMLLSSKGELHTAILYSLSAPSELMKSYNCGWSTTRQRCRCLSHWRIKVNWLYQGLGTKSVCLGCKVIPHPQLEVWLSKPYNITVLYICVVLKQLLVAMVQLLYMYFPIFLLQHSSFVKLRPQNLWLSYSQPFPKEDDSTVKSEVFSNSFQLSVLCPQCHPANCSATDKRLLN